MPAGKDAALDARNPGSTLALERDAAEARLGENVGAIRDLQHRLYAENARSFLLVLQAMDAGGKDSTIRGVFSLTNPQGVRVHSFSRPSQEELQHDFLWRVHRAAPARGEIGIFNRSHYEDVIVVRVDKLVPEKVWTRRYDAINAFESHLSATGEEIVKIYLHISKERQREKLVRRLTDPKRAWKFEPSDFEARRKWNEYMRAYEDAITRCSTACAPWYVVPSDHKWVRLLAVSEIVRARLEAMQPQFPEPRIDPNDAMRLIDQLV